MDILGPLYSSHRPSMHRDHTRNPLLSRNPSPRLMRHPDGSSSAVRRGATDRRPCHLLRCHSLDREGGSRGFQKHGATASARGWFQRFPEAWGNGIRHPRGWFQRFPETWGNGIRHPGCLRRQRERVTATTARKRSSWSGPGQKLMWWSRGLPSMADAGQTFPLAAPAAVPSASRWPAPVRPGH
jgi:hypothetical protein